MRFDQTHYITDIRSVDSVVGLEIDAVDRDGECIGRTAFTSRIQTV